MLKLFHVVIHVLYLNKPLSKDWNRVGCSTQVGLIDKHPEASKDEGPFQNQATICLNIRAGTRGNDFGAEQHEPIP